ncbi:MAG: aromatic/alkene monooxygenase hydroxylase subunit beta [Methylococcaceae bacterium]|nr:aromatic/alkene monooxygenase hydroxylase subunit beta [Methylococcaceae bacterium]
MSLEERKRGLTDPELAAAILAAIPDHALDTQRKMDYFVKPRGRRLSEYEALTCYAQPTPDWIPGGLDWGDWTQKFHGGRASWGNETTELKSSDWHHHRDPGRRWHAPYVKDKAEEWRYTERFLTAYSAEGQARTMDPVWRDDVLNQYLGAYCFNEYGLFNAHSSVSRDCLSDTIRVTATFVAFDKNDNAQMIQLERTFLAKIIPGFPESTDEPKKEWTQGSVYRGARETVEQIWQSTYDWNEILFATHMIYDPLFGQFVRREFFQRLASYYGDSLTPFFMNQMQVYFNQTKDCIADLYITCLADDQEFSTFNREIMRAWSQKWLSKTLDALRDFMGIFAKVPRIENVTCGEAVTAAVSRVVDDWIADYANKIDLKVNRDQMVKHILSGLK